MKKAGFSISVIYACLFVMLLAGQFVESFGVSLTIATGVRLLAFVILIPAYLLLWKSHLLKLPSGFWHIAVLLFFAYSLVIILRGDWELSIKEIASGLVSVDSTLIFLLPIMIIPLPNRRYFKTIMRVAYYFSLLTIPLWLLNINSLIMVSSSKAYMAEGIGMLMPFVSAFLLPLRGVLSKRERIVNLAVFSTYFILMLINARRNVCLSFTLFTIISFITVSKTFVRTRSMSPKTLVRIGLFFIVLIAVFSKPLLNGPFSFLKERAKENTRSGVTMMFFADMLSAPIEDWVIGRGMDGGYYQVFTNDETGDVSDDRQHIETGYLNNFLKGGILYEIFILLFMIHSVRTLLKSKRISDRYFGWILLVYFIDLYTTNPVSIFTSRAILFWILVSCSFQVKQSVAIKSV